MAILAKPVMVNILICLLITLMLFALVAEAVDDNTVFMPVAVSASCRQPQPKAGVAAAWGFSHDGMADKLCVSYWLSWSISGSDAKISNAPWMKHEDVLWGHFWIDGGQPRGESYLSQLEKHGCKNGRLFFLNEPDHKHQLNMRVEEAVNLYRWLQREYPECTLYGPRVSSSDWKCNRVGWYGETSDFYDEYQHHEDWCYLREFWAEYRRQTGRLPDIGGYAIHNYYDDMETHPMAPIHSYLSMMEELGADTEGRRFIMSEIGACNPEYMAWMVREYRESPLVEAYFGWLPNHPDPNYCMSMFKWGTDELTAVGRAFVDPYGNHQGGESSNKSDRLQSRLTHKP